jgi:hypothetical protein
LVQERRIASRHRVASGRSVVVHAFVRIRRSAAGLEAATALRNRFSV